MNTRVSIVMGFPKWSIKVNKSTDYDEKKQNLAKFPKVAKHSQKLAKDSQKVAVAVNKNKQIHTKLKNEY